MKVLPLHKLQLGLSDIQCPDQDLFVGHVLSTGNVATGLPDGRNDIMGNPPFKKTWQQVCVIKGSGNRGRIR
jgi:hypothetical protein